MKKVELQAYDKPRLKGLHGQTPHLSSLVFVRKKGSDFYVPLRVRRLGGVTFEEMKNAKKKTKIIKIN